MVFSVVSTLVVLKVVEMVVEVERFLVVFTVMVIRTVVDGVVVSIISNRVVV